MRLPVTLLAMALVAMALMPGACCAADFYTQTGLLDVTWLDGTWIGPADAIITTDLARLEEGQADMELVAVDLPYMGEGLQGTYRDSISEADAGKTFTYYVKHVARDSEGTVIMESEWCETESIARANLTPPSGCGVVPAT